MNHLLDDSDEDRPQHHQRGSEREITLGTTTILLIFFALAVYGAVTFGFGYSMGAKHSAPASAVAAAPASTGAFGSFSKPSPGSPIGASPKAPTADAAIVPLTPPPARISASDRQTDAAPVENLPPPPRSAPASPAAGTAVLPSSSAAPGGPSLVVQIAAVSHVEDAQMIASTLQRRGYNVNVMTEPDRLVHVQVGPFTTRKDAEAMKARLLSDGFNAYIK